MSYIEDDNVELKAIMNMFVAIDKLSKVLSFEQSIDALDIYFKTGNSKYITNQNGIREFVENSNIREYIFPVIDGKYDHLYDFIKGMYPKENNITK